jgi:hypothetical protein
MKIKVSEAEGLILDWLVAKAEGYLDYPNDSIERGMYWRVDAAKAPFGPRIAKESYSPSTNWLHGGPIIEREKINIDYYHVPAEASPLWFAGHSSLWEDSVGHTPLVAVMRCYVLSKLGAEVEIPDELR